MANSPHTTTTGSTSRFPEVEFGHTADGMFAARVADNAFAMAPCRDGSHYLVTAWRIGRPITEWKRADFYGHSGSLADEAGFRARVLENAEHQREKLALGRREIHSSASTPWGPSQGGTVFAEGITCHSTAGHGGFHLSADRNRKVHPSLRANRGWYEEDECWAIVAISFPHLFTSFERRCAESTMKDSWPDQWEAITGIVLQPGESRTKDERAFLAEHADDWLVQSAIMSDPHPGFTEVIATRGGCREDGVERRRFLVPSSEYKMGRFGFVIDTGRHAEYSDASSFPGIHGKRVA
ncbi:hypothetical protein [Mesorhizobium sp. CAU 1732]|uniref:DUF7007 domain-containing protein n=1 Tax=Mesorhizobium sp. CAU 1732 TaxID=3140358 RepID=UPI0032610E95